MLELWFYLEKHDLCVCVPCKCGSTSFRFAVTPGLEEKVRQGSIHIANTSNAYFKGKGHGPFSASEIYSKFPDRPRILAIRDPVSRFRSLWKDKCCQRRDNSWMSDWLYGKTPEELLSIIQLMPFGNAHWIPQYAYLVPNVELIDYAELLPRLGLEGLKHNSTEGISDCPMPEQTINEHYAQDLKLWESL